VWLSALAYGASAVMLLDDGDIPETVISEIDQQLNTARGVLAGMGYPEDVLQRVDTSGLRRRDTVLMPLIQPAAFAGSGGKRQVAYMAIDALYEQAVTMMPRAPLPEVELSDGAPFGTAMIDDGSCTACQSCVSACPGKALQSGQDVPQVRFIESNCLQCGLCVQVCPEDAISIAPRLLLSRDERNSVRTLYEEPPFCCVSCGKPFATRSVIDNMMAKLEGHWMFTDERSRQRLKMCEDCRVVDVVQDQDIMDRDLKQDRVTH
jgi:ferredoxin